MHTAFYRAIPDEQEGAVLQEEVNRLLAQIDCLRELIAELLTKNQHLREALEAGFGKSSTSEYGLS